MQDQSTNTPEDFAVFRAQVVSIFTRVADRLVTKANETDCPMRRLRYMDEAGKMRNVARSIKDITYDQIARHTEVLVDAAE